jgi:hypothetical protein
MQRRRRPPTSSDDTAGTRIANADHPRSSILAAAVLTSTVRVTSRGSRRPLLHETSESFSIFNDRSPCKCTQKST